MLHAAISDDYGYVGSDGVYSRSPELRRGVGLEGFAICRIEESDVAVFYLPELSMLSLPVAPQWIVATLVVEHVDALAGSVVARALGGDFDVSCCAFAVACAMVNQGRFKKMFAQLSVAVDGRHARVELGLDWESGVWQGEVEWLPDSEGRGIH